MYDSDEEPSFIVITPPINQVVTAYYVEVLNLI